MELLPGIPYQLADTMPHGAGFNLLDGILDYGSDHASCTVKIRSDSLFFEPGRGVPAWVSIEYLAQTVSVFGGIVRLQMGKPVQVALLLATQKFQCACDYFSEGLTLTARIQLLVQNGSGVGAFKCELMDGTRRLASADIKAYQPDDITSYLNSLRELPP